MSQRTADQILPPNLGGRPTTFPGRGKLFVGTCYRPIVRTPEQIRADIAIMKAANFNVVRIGDLSWDSFEPSDGVFDFSWSDSVIDQLHEAGIRVVLDIPGTPVPIWLHRKHPGIDLVNENGCRVPPAERYMDNIGDDDYLRYAQRLATKLLERYAKHPAILAIGYDNEIGNGFMSYSEADRQRFIVWLKNRYETLERLNKAWATQRWSRRLNSFDEVDLPLQNGPGPTERYLDLRRFWSDITIQRLTELEAVRRKLMPDTPTLSNLWDTSGRRGFDYLSSYKEYVSFGSEGFYPGGPIDGSFDVAMTKGDLPTPTWLNEFTAGGGGWYGDPGRSRNLAHVALLAGAQGIMAWTFHSHAGGEEQALFGLIDHDGQPSWKVTEWGQIAADFQKVAPYGFPRYYEPEVAIAYSFESAAASDGLSATTKQYYKSSYKDQVLAAWEPLYRKNVDAAVINIGRDPLSKYKLVIVPALYLVDEETAIAICEYVAGGGTVLMTGYSAKMNEHGQWFQTGLPGGVDDVFGIRTAAFYRNESGVNFTLEGQDFASQARYYELLEPGTAKEVGTITNSYLPDRFPLLTVNQFGKGQAFYLATESHASAMAPVLEYVKKVAGVVDGPPTPEGVFAREVEGRTYYVNTNSAEAIIPVSSPKKGILSGQTFQTEIVLAARGADLVEERASKP